MNGDSNRGRLRSVTLRHMYDEDGSVTGHVVSASYDRKKDDGPYPNEVETPHETLDGALDKVRERAEEATGTSKKRAFDKEAKDQIAKTSSWRLAQMGRGRK